MRLSKVFLSLAVIFGGIPNNLFSVSEPLSQANFPPPASPLNDAPLSVDTVIELERRGISEIPVVGLERILVVDPMVANAYKKTEADRIFIQGLAIGETYLHLWTHEGRKTVHIKVVASLKKADRAKSSAGQKLTVHHTLSSDIQKTDYTVDHKSYEYRAMNYSLSMEGATALGENRTSLYVDEQNGEKRVAFFRTELKNRAGALKLGNINAQVSQLAMPFSRFQGAQWSTPEKSVLGLNVFGGYTNDKFWGKSFSAFSTEPDNPFAGVKASLRPGKNMEVFVVGTRALNGQFAERQQNKSVGGRWKKGKFALRAEGAQASEGRGWYGDAELKGKTGYAIFTRRQVDANYVDVCGTGWERGRRGETFQLGLNPWRMFSQAGLSYDQFRDDYMTSQTMPSSLNREWRGNFKIENGWMDAVQEFTLRDFPGVSGPLQQDLYETKFAFLPKAFVKPRVTYRQELGRYYENAGMDYADSGVGAGFSLRAGKMIAFSLSAERGVSTLLGTGEEKTFTNWAGVMRMEGSMFHAWTQQLDFEYQKSTRHFSEEIHMVSAQLRTEYAMAKDASIFFSGRFENRISATSPSQAVYFRTGLQWTNEIGSGYLRSRRVEGSIFRDLNSDGVRQKEEPGMPNIRVFLNDSKFVKTDANGCFQFRPAKGVLTVKVETADLPQEMRIASSNPQTFDGTRDERTIRADFAVAHRGRISGSLYIDVNENGRIDADDRPLENAVLILDGAGSEVTDASGQFFFSDVEPGEHRVRVNVMSLPADMIFETPMSVSADLKEGNSAEMTFLIKAARSISGVVYWDQNGNGTRDPDEPAVAGIRMFTEVSEKVTGEDGKFFLNHFKGGTVTLNADLLDLYDGKWKPGFTLPKTFNVPKDQPFVLRNFDIPLVKVKK